MCVTWRCFDKVCDSWDKFVHLSFLPSVFDTHFSTVTVNQLLCWGIVFAKTHHLWDGVLCHACDGAGNTQTFYDTQFRDKHTWKASVALPEFDLNILLQKWKSGEPAARCRIWVRKRVWVALGTVVGGFGDSGSSWILICILCHLALSQCGLQAFKLELWPRISWSLFC